MSTVWNRARANNGRGLDDPLFERTAVRCEFFCDPNEEPPFFGAEQHVVPVPPEGDNWHLVRWIEDDEGRPATLWRRLKCPHEIVP
jgi:hypothetical protein